MKRSIATALALAAAMAVPASADTLREALVATYRANPTITAQRQSLRATDANVAIARAAGRPQVSATVGVNQDLTRTGGGNGRNFSAGADVSYPLFNGGSVRNSVRAAEARRGAGRAPCIATGKVVAEGMAAEVSKPVNEANHARRTRRPLGAPHPTR